jgi:DNA-binding MarR family transcriptional regulator
MVNNCANGRARIISLTEEEKVLLHLSKFRNYESRFEVPEDVTQVGIARATGLMRPNVSRSIQKLKAKGLVSESVLHVINIRRRRKVYFLTEEGLAYANKLKKSMVIAEREISVSRPRFVEFLSQAPKLKYFYGRASELRVLGEWLDSDLPKLIVIHGVTGIGKTTLAAKILSIYKEKRNLFWYRFHK